MEGCAEADVNIKPEQVRPVGQIPYKRCLSGDCCSPMNKHNYISEWRKRVKLISEEIEKLETLANASGEVLLVDIYLFSIVL